MNPEKNQAALAIVFKEDALLLTQRKDVSVWVLPGGGVEKGETPEAACLRELFEETGVRGEIVRQSHELSSNGRLSHKTDIFICRPLNEPIATSSESRDNRYFPLTALPKELFWVHKIWIDEALKNEKIVKRPLKEVNFTNLFLHFCRHPWQTLRFAWTRLTRS